MLKRLNSKFIYVDPFKGAKWNKIQKDWYKLFWTQFTNDVEMEGISIDKMKFEFDVVDDKKPEKGDCENCDKKLPPKRWNFAVMNVLKSFIKINEIYYLV